jgi:hypothetical protein
MLDTEKLTKYFRPGCVEPLVELDWRQIGVKLKIVLEARPSYGRPAMQEESDVLRSVRVAAMYTACFRLKASLHREGAAVAAGPDVIR